MAEMKRTDSLGTQLRKAIDGAKRRAVSPQEVRGVGRGNELQRVPQATYEPVADQLSVWTWRQINPSGLGAYAVPTRTAFANLVATGNYDVLSSFYVSRLGDISVHKTLSEAEMHLLSAVVKSDKAFTARLDINTKHSISVELDGQFYGGSNGTGPNRETTVLLPIPSGQSQIDIGVYSSGGSIDYELGGTLAAYTLIEPADRTAPDAPTISALSVTGIGPKQRNYRYDLQWTTATGTSNLDIHQFEIWRAEGAAPADSAFGLYDTINARPQGTANLYVDGDGITEGETYTYKLKAVDYEGNKSSFSAASGLVAEDTNAPGEVTTVYVNDSATANAATVALDANQKTMKVYWVAPSDTDYSHTEVRVYDQSTMNAATAFAGSYVTQNVFANASSEHTIFLAAEQFYGSNSFYVFLDAVDVNGNKRSDDSSPPYYFKVTFNEVGPPKDTIDITLSPEPNQFGWLNTSGVQVNFTYMGDDDSYTVGGEYAVSEGAWTSVGAQDYVLASVAGIGETSGTNVSLRKPGTTYGENIAATVLLRIDETAPTTPSSVTATPVKEGIRVDFTAGTDSLSGVWKSVVFRNTTNASGTAVVVGEVLNSGTQFVDSNIRHGLDEEYFYWVKTFDYAGNASAFSTVVSTKVRSSNWFNASNWVDNGGFERLQDWASGNTWESWEDFGTPGLVSGGNQKYGTYAASVTNGAYLTQRGIPVFKDDIFALSWWSWRDGTAATPEVRITSRDIAGNQLDNIILTSGTIDSGNGWTHFSANATGTQFVIGPSSSSAPYNYASGTHSIDVSVRSATAAFVRFDGVMLERVRPSGSSWINVETNGAAPSEFIDSRVENFDRIAAYVGRFGDLYANNLIAGKVQDNQGGNTYFDLDNAEIRLTHDSAAIWSSFTPTGIQKTLDSGTSFYNYPTFKTFRYDIVGATGGTINEVLASGFTDQTAIDDYFIVHTDIVEFQGVSGYRVKRPIWESGFGLTAGQGWSVLNIDESSETLRVIAKYWTTATFVSGWMEVTLCHNAFRTFEA